jgi:hypothetical protein
VATTPQQAIEICTHERRPGTTVCLHCRHAARLAAATRRKRLLYRGSAAAIVLVIAVAAATSSAAAIRGRFTTGPSAKPTKLLASSAIVASSKNDDSSHAPSGPTRVVQQGDVVTSPALPSSPASTPLAPAIGLGETTLPEGVLAQRVDSTVTVSFDAPMMRTRMPEKFERFLRASLGEVYGAAADSALARVPAGSIATSQASLLYDLPTRGIHIPLAGGWQIAVYPEIRPGADGPLVVRYRATVVAQN